MPLNSSVTCEAKVDMESSSDWNDFNGIVTLGGKHTTKGKKKVVENTAEQIVQTTEHRS